jgi:tricorn protease
MRFCLTPYKRIATFALACCALTSSLPLSSAFGQAEPDAGMLRYPDVSASRIVFVYAGDLWTVPREGGLASPLASPAGEEMHPRFNADGSKIAFVGNYDAGADIYVCPTAGGIAQRITFHPARESLNDWTPDGSLLFSTNGFAGLQRMSQLATISDSQPFPRFERCD